MKSAKLFTLDIEVVQKLKEEENASGLVNAILRKYFALEKYNLERIKQRENTDVVMIIPRD